MGEASLIKPDPGFVEASLDTTNQRETAAKSHIRGCFRRDSKLLCDFFSTSHAIRRASRLLTSHIGPELPPLPELQTIPRRLVSHGPHTSLSRLPPPLERPFLRLPRPLAPPPFPQSPSALTPPPPIPTSPSSSTSPPLTPPPNPTSLVLSVHLLHPSPSRAFPRTSIRAPSTVLSLTPRRALARPPFLFRPKLLAECIAHADFKL